jgi:hypothetical protein
LIGVTGNNRYSEVRTVHKMNLSDIITIKPNPVSDIATVSIEATEKTTADFILNTMNGRKLYSQKFPVTVGSNTMKIPVKEDWPDGMYILRIIMNNEIADKKLVIHK